MCTYISEHIFCRQINVFSIYCVGLFGRDGNGGGALFGIGGGAPRRIGSGGGC